MSTRDEKDMNCEDFRQAVATDPSFEGGDSHVAACAECSAYQAKMQALDVKIAKAMELSTPDLKMPDLPEIDSSNVATLPARRIAPTWFAVAATVVIAAVVGVRMLGPDLVEESLAEQIIEHIDHEPYGLRVTNTPISDTRLNDVVPDDVAEIDHSAGLITYAQSCKINGKDVPHLVIQGEHGPVTILLMPDEYVAEASSIDGENIKGVILPIGKGSIAIIGDREERLDEIQEKVVDSVAWDV
jgi:hypothetical protein